MSDLADFLRDNLQHFDAAAALDVAIISLIFFWLLLLLKGTTAMAVMRGAFILLLGLRSWWKLSNDEIEGMRREQRSDTAVIPAEPVRRRR